MCRNGPSWLALCRGNDGGNANHWVRLALKGNGKTSNRDAIGAKVEIKMGDQTCRRQLFPAKSYLSSIEFPLTFGLGNAQKVDELTITWPSGTVTTQKDLKADRIYHVNGVGRRSVTSGEWRNDALCSLAIHNSPLLLATTPFPV